MSPAENNQNSLVEPSRPPGKVDNPHDCLDKLFVWRKELQDLIDFATTETVSRRLRTVAGPPGYGKTCLLHKLHQTLNQKDDLFIVWVPTHRFKGFDDLEQWLRDVVDQAQKICPDVAKIAQNDTPEAIIAHLLEELGETCAPAWRIILIIDALDELPNNLCRALEDRFLAQFWRKLYVRMVISFRDEFSLKSPNLRRGEKRIFLNAFSPAQGRDQIQKRAQYVPEPHKISFEALLQLVEPYQFNLPRLNTILSQKVYFNELANKTPVLTSVDVRSAWLELINSPLASSDGYAAILENDLKTIVTYAEDSWTLEVIAQVCGFNQFDPFKRLQDLMALSVVVPHPKHKKRHMVVDGLRELLRAELRMKQGGDS